MSNSIKNKNTASDVETQSDYFSINKKTLRQCWVRSFSFDVSWNYERMQGLSFLYSIYPALEEIYDDKDDLRDACNRHLQFFNTNGTTGAVCVSTAIVAEERRDGDAAHSSKISLMGPMAGIGDTLLGVLWKPVIGAIAGASLLAGNLSGAFLYLLQPLLCAVLRLSICNQAYKAASSFLGQIGKASNTLPKITAIFSSIGLTVIGGFIPMVLSSVKLKPGYSKIIDGVESKVPYQTILDAIVPNLIVISAVGVIYYLLHKREMSPINVIGLTACFAFITSLLGIL